MYESSETIRRLAIEKQRQLMEEAELSRLIAEQHRARRRRLVARLSAWLGQRLIEAGEWMLQDANQEMQNVRERTA